MKIKNIEKFRNEPYKAIKSCVPYYGDGAPYECQCSYKSEYEDTFCGCLEDNVPEYHKVGDGFEVVALPNPLVLGDTGYYIIVDNDAWVRIYKSTQTHFKSVDYMSPNYEVNKLSFAMEVIRKVDHLYKISREEA